MQITNFYEKDLNAIIAEMDKAHESFFILSTYIPDSQSVAVFAAKEWLEMFRASDNVTVAGRPLENNWGTAMINVTPDHGGYTFETEYGINIRPYRAKTTVWHSSAIEEIAKDLLAASRFVRNGTVVIYSVADVMKMAKEVK